MLMKIFIAVVVTVTVASRSVAKIFQHPQATNNLHSILHVGNKSYIAGINYVLVLNRLNESASKIISFKPTASQIQTCNPGVSLASQLRCTNSITGLLKINSSLMLACGTNVYKQACFNINLLGDNLEGTAFQEKFLPHDAYARPVSVVLHGKSNTDDDQLYFGICQPYLACTIYRYVNNRVLLQANPARSGHSGFSSTSTVFHSMYASEGAEDRKIYTFFTDTNDAFINDGFGINPSSPVESYGMVAKLCEADEGGNRQYYQALVTFFTARLICPYPGGKIKSSSSAYFNELVSTSKVGNIVYALFNLPRSWKIPASAICAYNLDIIERYFNGSAFDDGIAVYYVPKPPTFEEPLNYSTSYRPGQCPPKGVSTTPMEAIYKYLIDQTVLLRKGIPPLNNEPSYVTISNVYRFVVATEIGPYHIMYMASEKGLLQKIRVDRSTTSKEVKLYEIQLDITEDILSLSFHEQDLFILTQSQLIQHSPSDCSIHSSCTACEADPYCNWIFVANNQTLLCSPDPSEVLIKVTCPSAPPHPGNVTTSGTSPSLSITVPSPPSGAQITSYMFEVIRKADDAVVMRRKSTTPQVLDVDLPPGVEYIISVKAMNGLVRGIASTANYTEGLLKPNVKIDATEETSFILVWDVVSGAETYTINVYNDSSPNSAVRSYVLFQVSQAEQTFGVVGLSQNTGYTVSMFATSQYGIKSPASTLSVSTASKVVPVKVTGPCDNNVVSKTTSSEATSSQATSSQATSSQATSSQATSSQATSRQATLSQATSRQATLSQSSTSGSSTCRPSVVLLVIVLLFCHIYNVIGWSTSELRTDAIAENPTSQQYEEGNWVKKLYGFLKRFGYSF